MRFKKRFLNTILIYLFISIAGKLYPGVVDSIYLKVEIIRLLKDDIEVTKGELYRKHNTEVLFFVHSPIKQVLMFYDKTLRIYYPDDNILYVVDKGNNLLLDFYNIFVDYNKEDLGLSAIGYKLKNVSIKSDTLTFIWYPMKKLSKYMGKCVLTYYNDNLIKASYYNPSQIITRNLIFSDLFHRGALIFPRNIVIDKCAPEINTKEIIKFEKVAFDITIPDSIQNYSIPNSVQIKDLVR